ncbi:MAG TPA: MmcB family DNA repair protein [Candidatus Acidoferrales bacterium]|nr:MmcB family DNA repair protein [Candidatus Acidoferrales bacterium]
MIDYIPLTPSAGRVLGTELTSLAAARMRDLGYAWTAQEFSPARTGLRFDIIGVTRHTRQVRIYEVKSSRADFLRDSKWERYLPFCTHFAFVAPAGVIARFELERGVGLIEYGAPAFERMRRARRFGLTILREDCLRAVKPSLRLRDRVEDEPWIALLEAMAFGGRPEPLEAALFTDGAGI